METITIKEFQKKMFFYFNNLPISITRKGKVVATLVPYNKEVVTTMEGSYPCVQVPENKKEVEVTTKVTTTDNYEVIYD